jgi:hypothetical protein
MVKLKASNAKKVIAPIYNHKMSKQEEKKEQEQEQKKKEEECDCSCHEEFPTEDELEDYRYKKWLARTEQREEGHYY